MSELEIALKHIDGMDATPEQKERLSNLAFARDSLRSAGYECIKLEGGELWAVAPPHSEHARLLTENNEQLRRIADALDDVVDELAMRNTAMRDGARP